MCLTYLFGLVAAVTAFFEPKWFLVISVICSFLCGFLIGTEVDPPNHVLGIFLGLLFSFTFLVGGISGRYIEEGGMYDIINLLKKRKK